MVTTRLKVSAGDYLRELESIREFVGSRPIASTLVDTGNALNMQAVNSYFENNFISGRDGRIVPHTLSREEGRLFALHPATVVDHSQGREVYYKSIFIGKLET